MPRTPLALARPGADRADTPMRGAVLAVRSAAAFATALVLVLLVALAGAAPSRAATPGTWSSAAAPPTYAEQRSAVTLTSGRIFLWDQNDSRKGWIYDPATNAWTATPQASTQRQAPAVAALPGGKVLVAGGYGNGYLASSEVFDPATGAWTSTGSMSAGTYYASSATLPSGKVLVSGGYGQSGRLNTAQTFDPTTGSFSAVAAMGARRSEDRAHVLSNGKVLVIGGYTDDAGKVGTGELYDPAANTWTTTGVVPDSGTNTYRYDSVTAALPDGKALIAGGYTYTSNLNVLRTAAVYDPATNAWTATGSMTRPRRGSSAIALSSGKVLVATGYDDNGGGYISSAELYDPATGTFAATGSLATARYRPALVALPGGDAVAFGGEFNGVRSAERYAGGPAVPENTTAPAVTGTAKVGGTLTTTDGTWSGAAPIAYTRQWQRCDAAGANCADVDGATGTTYDLVGADAGRRVRVVVTAKNDVGEASKASAATAKVTWAPENVAAPTVSGTPRDGLSLSASTGEWQGAGPIAYAYAWQRCDAAGDGCAAIAGATNASYTPDPDDVGHALRVGVTATNGDGAASKASDPSGVVASGFSPNANAQIDVQKGSERLLDLDPGETATDSAVCPSGTRIVDGSWLVQHVDQDTGRRADVLIPSSKAEGDDRWTVTATNATTGKAQVKVFASCVATATRTGGRLDLTDPRTERLGIAANQVRRATLTCARGSVAIAASFDLGTTRARLVSSEPSTDGRSWTLAFRGTDEGVADVAIRCLSTAVSNGDRLIVASRGGTETVGGQERRTGQIDVGQDRTALAAGFTVPADGSVVVLGREGQDRTAVYSYENTGDAAQTGVTRRD